MPIVCNMSLHIRDNTCWISIAFIDHLPIYSSLWLFESLFNWRVFSAVVLVAVFGFYFLHIGDWPDSGSIVLIASLSKYLESTFNHFHLIFNRFLGKLISKNFSLFQVPWAWGIVFCFFRRKISWCFIIFRIQQVLIFVYMRMVMQKSHRKSYTFYFFREMMPDFIDVHKFFWFKAWIKNW